MILPLTVELFGGFLIFIPFLSCPIIIPSLSSSVNRVGQKKFPYKVVRFVVGFGTAFALCNFHAKKSGMGFAVLICRKSLQHKHLRRAWRARLALSPLAARVYVGLSSYSEQLYTLPSSSCTDAHAFAVPYTASASTPMNERTVTTLEPCITVWPYRGVFSVVNICFPLFSRSDCYQPQPYHLHTLGHFPDTILPCVDILARANTG